jgi:crossover junction endodeoxyribonuclease RuvC
MSVIGIDPGQHGAVAFLNGDLAEAIPTPLNGKEIDGRELAAWLYLRKPGLIVIEKVGAMPRQGVSSTFKFGRNFGMLLGVVEALGLPYRLVTPQAWKKVVLAGTSRDKLAAIEHVHRAYPAIDLTPGRRRTPHDGIADAVCLAEYGRKMLCG